MKFGDLYKAQSERETEKPELSEEEHAAEEKRRYAISRNLGDHYRDRRKRLEDASKDLTKSDLPVRTSKGIIGVRG